MTAKIPPSWRTIQLHEVCRPKQWQTIKKSEMTETGFPVYGANGTIGRYHSFNHVKPTILIGCRGTCGAVNVCEPNSWVTGNAMALEDLDTSRVDFNFIVHALRADGLRDAITGTSQPQITQTSLKRIHLPLPPLKEQWRIARVLDVAEALGVKRQQALAKLDNLTQALFIDMFGDPAQNPKRFDKAALGDLIKLKSGQNLPAKDMHPGPHLVYGGNGVSGTHDQYMFEKRQIVIGRVGVYCGCVHISEPQSWITDNALYVRSMSSRLRPRYLVAALEQAKLNQYASQAAQPLISGSRVYPVEILVPNKTDQIAFEQRIRAVEALRELLDRDSKSLDILFASLQQRAFRGEL